MKRRQVLGAAGAAGLAVVGGEAVAGYGTVPAKIVPNDSTQYQVEIVFLTTKAVTVRLRRLNPTTRIYDVVDLATKNVTTSNMHRVGLALLQTGSTAGFLASDFGLAVLSGSDATIFAGKGGTTTSDDFRQYTTYSVVNHGTTGNGWTFYSRSDKTPLATVRFIPIPTAEKHTMSNYYHTVTHPTHHENVGTRSTSDFPVMDNDTVPVANNANRVSVLHEPTLGKDTLLIPNLERTGHRELWSPSMAVTGVVKKMVMRRHSRTMRQFCKHLRIMAPGATMLDNNISTSIRHEMLKLTGGRSLIDYLKGTLAEVKADAAKVVGELSSELLKVTAQTSSLMTQDLRDSHRSLVYMDRDDLDGIGPEAPSWLNAGFSGAATTAVQVGASFVTEAGPFPSSNLRGIGFRVSWLLAQSSARLSAGLEGVVDHNYDIADLSSKGGKLSLVAIIKGPKAGPATIDVEITFVLAIKNGKVRLDAIMFDPVFDVDIREGNNRIFWEAAAVITATTFTTVPFLDRQRNLEVSPFSQVGLVGATYISGIVETAEVPTNPTTCAGTALAKVKAVASKANGDLGGARTWSIVEISPFRLIFPNGKLLTDPNFKEGGFTWIGFAWAPGIKHIGGGGADRNSRSKLWSGFARLVTVVDFGGAVGNTDALKCIGFVPR